VYGEAGVGKTNLVLWLLSNLSRTSGLDVVYISTEGPLYSSLLSRYEFPENTLFAEVYDINSLLQVVFRIYSFKKLFKAIAIDSINNFYRVEVLQLEGINKILNTILALLADMVINRSLTCILTAQVSQSEEDVRVSGFQILKYWYDILIRLERVGSGVRRLSIEYPKDLVLSMSYVISDRGIEWVGND
jgi:KaiC/GvpD/RAD55 family RecA-like ATPase